MKWVKWSVNDVSGSVDELRLQCKARFNKLKITDSDFCEDERYSFTSIETCKYKYDVPKAESNNLNP